MILFAEDDEDQFLLASEAFEQAGVTQRLERVKNGEELMDYLRKMPLPSLVLLDLNMPKKDGREVLREMKADPVLRSIPVVVLTTSTADNDVKETYDLGANTYLVKPMTYKKLVDMAKVLNSYWFEFAKIPN